MSRRVVRVGSALAVLVSGLVAVAAPSFAVGPPIADEVLAALDAPAGVTVTLPADPLSYAVASTAFNDLPSRGSSYVVLSSGQASDMFSTTVPNAQPSTDLGATGPDVTTMTVGVDAGPAESCLLVDFSMATEERVHTYTTATPSDYVSVKLVGDSTEYAMNRGGAYINQSGVAADDVKYEVNGINYWHTPGDASDPLHGTVEDPRLPAGTTPFDWFTTRDTAEVPIPAAGGSVTVTVADTGNGKLDSAALIDHVRLAPSCSTPSGAMYPDTGISTGTGRIDGYRGVGNTLTLDPDSTTADVIEKYDDADNGWFPDPVELRFRWYRNKVPGTSSCYSTSLSSWVAIEDGDRQSYVPKNVDKGYCLMVRVTGMKDGYRSETFPNSAAPDQWYVTLPIQDGVFAAEEPTVTGDFSVGGDVTVHIPTFTPRPDSYSIQWYAGSSGISGQTGPVLRLTAEQAGKQISARITAMRSGFANANKASPAYGPVALQVMTSAGTPTISGAARYGSQVTAQPGTWAPTPDAYTYQWRADGDIILNAVSATYTPKSGDVGRQLSVEVTGAKSGYVPLKATSAAVTVEEGVMGGAAPTINGTPKVGQQLTASTSGWLPAGSMFTYTWKADGTTLSSGPVRTLTIPGSAAGKKITVVVTGESQGYATAVRASTATAVVAKGTIVAPTPGVTGVMKVGTMVTARALNWAPYNTRLSYQWLLDGKAYTSSSTSRLSWKLPKSSKGKRVSVRVTGSLTGWTTLVKTSARTSRVRG